MLCKSYHNFSRLTLHREKPFFCLPIFHYLYYSVVVGLYLCTVSKACVTESCVCVCVCVLYTTCASQASPWPLCPLCVAHFPLPWPLPLKYMCRCSHTAEKKHTIYNQVEAWGESENLQLQQSLEPCSTSIFSSRLLFFCAHNCSICLVDWQGVEKETGVWPGGWGVDTYG